MTFLLTNRESCDTTIVLYRVQLNEAQDEIMKKKELLEDLQPDNTQTCKTSSRLG